MPPQDRIAYLKQWRKNNPNYARDYRSGIRRRHMTIKFNTPKFNGKYCRNCPVCGKILVYANYAALFKNRKKNAPCKSCANKQRPQEYWDRMQKAVNIAMHRPDVRKKHIAALHASKWLKVKTDLGQLELLEKWNRLGFKFEPNHQVHTDTDLFYVDGYDSINNVVLEYDGKYHHKPSQQKKDEIRQQKLIDILKPKKFWRYDALKKQFRNVLESKG